jgi:phenylalanyl-tRNA synthetase beta chain
VVLVLELTPNRADCLSVINVAREVAALTGAPLNLPATTVPEDERRLADLATVAIEAPDLCARYVARLVSGVRIGPSPVWLQARLRAAGMRPINNVVTLPTSSCWRWASPCTPSTTTCCSASWHHCPPL